MRTPGRIAVFRALQLGDMLCSVPALRALRSAYPQARIVLVGLPWAAEFVCRYAGLIDELVVFPGAPGFPEQAESAAGLPAFYAAARSRRYDLAIQLHGSGGPANDIVLSLGASMNAGFLQPGEKLRAGCFIPWPDTAPEPERYLLLMQAMGLPADDAALWMPLMEADRAEADRLLAGWDANGARAVIVHPGAQLPSRRWPAARFAAVADALAGSGAYVLLTGSPAEVPLVQEVASRMTRPASNLAGRTTLGGLAALVERVSLVVCNDTGLSHVAAAMRTPSVVIASGSDTRRWAPANRSLHRVIARYPDCRPCSFAVCPVGHACALGVTPVEVIAAARQQLAGHAHAA